MRLSESEVFSRHPRSALLRPGGTEQPTRYRVSGVLHPGGVSPPRDAKLFGDPPFSESGKHCPVDLSERGKARGYPLR